MSYVLFNATTYNEGQELWISDGTSAGTRLLKSYTPGEGRSEIRKIVTAGDLAYVLVSAEPSDWHIDVVDGNGRIAPLPAKKAYGWSYNSSTGESTYGEILFNDIGTTSDIHVLGEDLFFRGSQPDGFGEGMFRFDADKRIVTQINKESFSEIFEFDDALFGFNTNFFGETRINRIDADGTVSLALTIGGEDQPITAQRFAVVGNKFVFSQSDDVHGTELWVSDGTQAGTRLLKDFVSGPVGGLDDANRTMFTWEQKRLAFFEAKDRKHGNELWVTDGTATGTKLIRDLNPGKGDSATYINIYGNDMIPWGDKLIFRNQIVSADPLESETFWITDGTSQGTKQLKFEWNGREVLQGSSYGDGVIGIGDYFYFSGYVNDPREPLDDETVYDTGLFRHNIKTGKTDLLKNINTTPWMLTGSANYGTINKSDEITEVTRYGNGFLFSARDTYNPDLQDFNTELWFSDGTAAGTRKVKDIYPGFGGDSGEILEDGSSNPAGLTVFGDPRATGVDDVIRVTKSGGDTVDGGRGNDVIYGGKGKDTLKGGEGDDTLLGGPNGDTLIGGKGRDTAAYGNTKTSVTASLADRSANAGGATGDSFSSIENLKGGQYRDTLEGDKGRNVLDGGRGGDILRGGDGDDTYVVDNRGDKVIEGSSDDGVETIRSSVTFTLASRLENLALTGSAKIDATGNRQDNALTGNGVANKLRGGDGDDVLTGRGGRDFLSGGKGKDAFLFDAKLDAKKNVDTISDFSRKDDVLKLDNDVFKGLKSGTLGSDAFHLGTKAADKEDRILYDMKNGNLYFDRDGTKDDYGAVRFAAVDDKPTLDRFDLLVV